MYNMGVLDRAYQDSICRAPERMTVLSHGSLRSPGPLTEGVAMTIKDISGKRFGKLIAMRRLMVRVGRRKLPRWECQCDCGRITFVGINKLISGHTRSCGCLRNGGFVTIDLHGKRFGRLVVIRKGRHDNSPQTRWFCRCDCGGSTTARSQDLRQGKTGSCGCLHNELLRKMATKHGLSHTSEHSIWRGMIDRCTNPRNPGYRYYGGMGVSVCDEWMESFEKFLKHIGRRPDPKLSIDRIDCFGNYEPGNVRWATRSQQAYNQRRWHKKHERERNASV